jgi:hypothetical protein
VKWHEVSARRPARETNFFITAKLAAQLINEDPGELALDNPPRLDRVNGK